MHQLKPFWDVTFNSQIEKVALRISDWPQVFLLNVLEEAFPSQLAHSYTHSCRMAHPPVHLAPLVRWQGPWMMPVQCELEDMSRCDSGLPFM